MPKRGGGGAAFGYLRPGMIIIVKQVGGDSYALRSIPEVGGGFVAEEVAHRPRAGDAGRLRRRRLELQPRHPGAAPAGLDVQADRLCRPRSKTA